MPWRDRIRFGIPLFCAGILHLFPLLAIALPYLGEEQRVRSSPAVRATLPTVDKPGALAAETHHILVDSIHAHNFLDTGLEVGNRNYHSLFGAKDGFSYLARQGFKISVIADGTLTEDVLKKTDSLFINLVSDNLPPFLVEEIFAIRQFLEGGGNVLVITDHSNAYHHTWKLMPLFKELGIKLYNESALEIKPRTLGGGPGWIIIESFKPHPITENLSVLSFHSGGTVDDNGAVALLSADGWGDLWETAPFGENSFAHGNRGNYGNFKREADERSGPLGVVLAREIGEGKLVVVGDQNALGNLWLRFGDNYKLYMNIYRWFSGKTELADYRTFQAPNKANILMLDNLEDSSFADYRDQGFYHAFAHLGRYHDVYIHQSIDSPYDLIIVSPSIGALNERQSTALNEHLRQGRSILVAGNPQNDGPIIEAEEGLTLTRRFQAGNRVVFEYDSGARVEIHFDLTRFHNQFITDPMHEPDQAQEAAAQAWLELVNTFLS